LPQSVRDVLPAKLQMAAEHKVFTVDYSIGRSRTLYVFADPECPNCQRLEPALEAASQGFNVVVFPVAVIGREKSIASITPVLCLPPDQRKAAWSALFDIGKGVMEMGKAAADKAVTPAEDCDVAGKALGVNEVAYQTYRIPGTPWVIADDGRHVPQDVLQNPLKLQAFMNDAEVNHAAQ
jgi:TrbB protein